MLIETLETRRLMSLSIWGSPTGIFSITGTNNNQLISVSYNKTTNQIDVYEFDYNTRQNGTRRFLTSGIKQLRVAGGGGNDHIIVGPDLNLPAFLIGEDGNDVLTTHSRGETFLVGGPGQDSLTGGPGNDFLFGDDGHDVLNGGYGTDGMWGGPGVDTATYAGRAGRVFLVANGYATSGADLERDSIQSDIENLTGGTGNDYLLGSQGVNHLLGGPGNDYIYGLGGNDILLGEAGNDFLVGGEGSDVMYGGDGADFLDARDNFGNDIVWGDGGPGIFRGTDQALANRGDRIIDIERLTYS